MSAREEITKPKVVRDLLMLLPSLSRSPRAPVFPALSLPARSTRLILATFSVPSWRQRGERDRERGRERERETEGERQRERDRGREERERDRGREERERDRGRERHTQRGRMVHIILNSYTALFLWPVLILYYI